MRRVIYSFGVSLDGFIAGPGGDFSWSAPDEELHRFHNDQAREVGVHLYGRGLYEVMRYWETAEEDPSQSEVELEFARVWKATPKIVFSKTLEEVERGFTLAEGDLAAEVARLKAQDGGDIAVGGAGLAASLIKQGLVDEYGLIVHPVVVGAGTPFFPPGVERIDLRLLETRTFGGVVYLRYETAAG